MLYERLLLVLSVIREEREWVSTDTARADSTLACRGQAYRQQSSRLLPKLSPRGLCSRLVLVLSLAAW
jgi:hypothetical protein